MKTLVLYHGTSEPASKIKNGGLIPGHHESVFLTDNPKLAIDYAYSDQARTGSSFVVVAAVSVDRLNKKLLYGDIDHSNIENWRESLRETDQCVYRGSIPPEVLTVEDYSD